MPLINMADLRAGLRRNQRLIGLDPGTKTIGVALTDVALLLATPTHPIPRTKLAQIAAHIIALATKEGAGGLVVGHPISMDGTAGPAAQAARDWATALSAATNLPAALWDERLSTAAVTRHLITDLDLTRRKRAALVDGMAAAYTLQAALDATRPFPDNTQTR